MVFDIKAGGRCPSCGSPECDELDIDYGLDKDNNEIQSRAMICTTCNCQFTDEYRYIETRIIHEGDGE